MFSYVMSAITLILAAPLGSLLSPVQAGSPGATIADLITVLDLSTAPDSSYSDDANFIDVGNPPSNASDTGVEYETAKRSFQDLHQQIFSASYTAPRGQTGYNITIPGDICANNVIGNFVTPEGVSIPDATIDDIYNAVPYTSARRRNDTLHRALAVQSTLNTTLLNVICAPPANPGASRDILFRYDRADVEGFWSAFIIGGLGVGGIAFVGLQQAIVNKDQGLISATEEVWILAATALAQYILVTIIFRLQHVRAFSRGEAFVLNVFIAMGEAIGGGCKRLWATECAAPDALRDGIRHLAQSTVNRLQGFEPRRLGTGGDSSINLVGQDIEQGQRQEAVGGGQICT